MNQLFALARVRHVTDGLSTAAGEPPGALREWQRRLAELVLRHPDLVVEGLQRQHEGTEPAGDAGSAAEDSYAHLADVLERPAAPTGEAAPRVFRRETAFRSTLLGSSVPAWAAGMAPAESFGPFVDALGPFVWFDVFHRVRFVDVVATGSTTPLLRLPIRLPLTARNSYRIEAGSAWLASGLIARDPALAGHYTGLRVRGGVLELSQAATLVSGQLVLASSTTANLKIQLDQQPAAAGPGAAAGLDAARASVHLPETLGLLFTAHSSSLSAAPARCQVFGTEASLVATGAAASWLSPLQHILVPYAVSVQGDQPKRFTIESSASELCSFSGGATVQGSSGWLLPALKLDPSQLGTAAGTGALCIGLGHGLVAQWKGLKGGATALPQPAIVVEPGLVSVVDLAARNLTGRQRWTLWRQLQGAHHADITLTFAKAFGLLFVSSAADSEALVFFCGHRGAFDRPVDGQGTPFKVESSLALAGMQQFHDRFFVELLDTDLLADGASAKPQPDAEERHALMLRNAYFQVSRPYSLFLAGELTGEATIRRGTLALSFATDLYLPTLPDPYVASYTAALRDTQAIEFGRPDKGLTAFVKWAPHAALEASGDGPAQVSFRFTPYRPSLYASLAAMQGFKLQTQPLGLAGDAGKALASPSFTTQASNAALGALGGFGAALTEVTADFRAKNPSLAKADAVRLAVADLAAHPLLRSLPDAAQQIASTFGAATQQRGARLDSLEMATGRSKLGSSLGRVGGRYFEPDLFTLLDVSTHADQMGISLGGALRVVQGPNGDARVSRIDALAAAASSVMVTPGIDLQIDQMDVVAPAANLRALTLPQVSWEPVFNIPLAVEGGPAPDDLITVAPGVVLYENDGIPTRLFSESPFAVPMAPLPVTQHFLKAFHDPHTPRALHSVFTLPFAMLAQADFLRDPALPPSSQARLSLHRPHFDELRGSLQIQALAPSSDQPKDRSPEFPGFTLQLDNVHWFLFGLPLPGSTLGATVRDVFNGRFAPDGDKPSVPLERIEFSGYGASIFSDWRNAGAAVADVSQAAFDVIVGRTAREVVQVRSILYPFGVHLVRTVTLMRSANGYVFRTDSGWKPESDGFYDFGYTVKFKTEPPLVVPQPYVVHAQPVKGVSKVREIRDFPAGGTFTSSFRLDDPTLPFDVRNLADARLTEMFAAVNSHADVLPVRMQAVVFDADVHLDGVVSGGSVDPLTGDTVVQSRQMLGYVQLAPSKLPVPGRVFAELLAFQKGSLGGPVDCTVEIAHSKQRMRLNRVDVNPALDGAGQPIFVSAARGSLILPADGAWSMVVQQTDSGDVKPLEPGLSVPLIKPNGQLNFRIGHPADAVVSGSSKLHFGVLQSTGTQKLLFDVPQFTPHQAALHSAQTYYADAYKLLNSKGVFPNVANALGLTAAERTLDIVGEGLMKLAERQLHLDQLLPANYKYAFIDEPGILKVYAEYETQAGGAGKLVLGIDSTAAALADRWKAAMANMRIVVDLGPFQRLMWVDGNFNAGSGLAPQVAAPHLQFGPVLQPVVDILRILAKLNGDDFDSGMNVGMSNSADNWEYKFNCSKEIPVIKFPSPLELTVNPNPPLKLEAGLRVGFYFNEVLSIPGDLKQLVPAAGAYVDFFGRLEVQCFTLGAASVYGTGQVTLGIAADSKAGIALHMKFGFGAEIVVGLPVLANVAVMYMAEVEVALSASSLQVTGLILFRGSAEICGGLVAVCIQIEAGGAVSRDFNTNATSVIAQVSFSIDVCVLWVIDIDYHDSWQEQRRIA